MAANIESPSFEKTWQTDTLDTGQILDEVNRLWDQLGELKVPAPVLDHSDDDEAVPLIPALMRALTVNLIAVAGSQRNAEFIERTISQLQDFLPSRSVILLIRADEDDSVPTFSVKVELHTQHGGLPFETITIETDVREVGHLASLVAPLLNSELPSYLWWPQDVPQARSLFSDVSEIVDRLTLDTSRLITGIKNSHRLRDVPDVADSDLVIGDFTWLRLATWRQLIAQFFDPEDVRPCLDSISEINISYAADRPDGSSGLAAAFLAVGWLSSRLGWEVLEPVETNRAGVSWASLRARPEGGRQHDILVRLTPDPAPQATFSLRRVELIATGEHPGTFRVERTDNDDLITSSETPSIPFVSRMVYSKRPGSAMMLGAEVQRLSPDHVYDEALATALKLLP